MPERPTAGQGAFDRAATRAEPGCVAASCQRAHRRPAMGVAVEDNGWEARTGVELAAAAGQGTNSDWVEAVARLRRAGLHSGAVRHRWDRPVKNGRWFVCREGLVARSGWGDLSLAELRVAGRRWAATFTGGRSWCCRRARSSPMPPTVRSASSARGFRSWRRKRGTRRWMAAGLRRPAQRSEPGRCCVDLAGYRWTRTRGGPQRRQVAGGHQPGGAGGWAGGARGCGFARRQG